MSTGFNKKAQFAIAYVTFNLDPTPLNKSIISVNKIELLNNE